MVNLLAAVIGVAIGLELADMQARRRFAKWWLKHRPRIANTTPPTTAQLVSQQPPSPIVMKRCDGPEHYISLAKQFSDRQVELAPGVIIDLTAKGDLCGIELLDCPCRDHKRRQSYPKPLNTTSNGVNTLTIAGPFFIPGWMIPNWPIPDPNPFPRFTLFPRIVRRKAM